MGRHVTKNRDMTRVNVREAKAHLSHYLALLAEGETVVLCKRNVPVAELRPLKRERAHARPVGLAKGRFEIPPELFDSLPEEMIEGFEGI